MNGKNGGNVDFPLIYWESALEVPFLGFSSPLLQILGCRYKCDHVGLLCLYGVRMLGCILCWLSKFQTLSVSLICTRALESIGIQTTHTHTILVYFQCYIAFLCVWQMCQSGFAHGLQHHQHLEPYFRKCALNCTQIQKHPFKNVRGWTFFLLYLSVHSQIASTATVEFC